MNLKRILTTIIGLPLVGIVLILGNKYIIDFALMGVAIICMYEYFKVISKVAHPIKWVGYLSTVIIALIAFLSAETIMQVVVFAIPFLILIMFLKVIITNMETTFKDVAYTFLGICYITFFIMFLSLIRGLDNGKFLIGFVILVGWSTDIFAYLIGKHFGKHHFSKVSPNKTIEGCISGMVGAVIVGVLYTLIVNQFYNTGINSYIIIAVTSLVLSILSQVGDFVASSIKRFADSKDYGDLIPGHGGMLDRIDSLIFIAPFAYLFFSLII